MAEQERTAGRSSIGEPLLWIFLIVAAGVTVFVLTGSGSQGTDASFAVADDATAPEAPLPQALPTPVPTVAAEASSAKVELVYGADSITLSGVVPAEAVGQGIIAAAGELVDPAAVVSTMVVDASSSLTGATLVITGQVDDDSERRLVIDTFSDLGLAIEDRLIVAGSDLTVAQQIAADPELSQFHDFLSASGVIDRLNEPSEAGLTVFAPTNAAVTELDSIVFDELSDVEKLTEVLTYHVVEGRSASGDLAGVTALTSLQGESIAVSAADGAITVGRATIIRPDVDATNGVVHVVDAVLLPGTLRMEVELNDLVTRNPILFASGSATILDDSLPILDQAAAILAENPLGRVEIQGHTDTDGPAKVNLELSQDRADAVRDHLIAQGVDEVRLTAVGYGETELLVDPEETDDDKAANRRIEFRVS